MSTVAVMRAESPGTFRGFLAGGVALALFLSVAYWPYFYTFLGTDLGVYWEVSRRLYRDGQLAIGTNYWDHKPPAIYLALLPWHALTQAHAELLGLKLGVMAIYVAGCGLVAAAMRYARVPVALATGGAALAGALALSASFDAAQNGVAAVAGLCCEASGLLLMIGATSRPPSRKTRFAAALSGVLLSAAPFWRPTSIAGGSVLLVLGVWSLFRRAKQLPTYAWEGAVLRGFVFAAAGVGVWCLLVVALGSTPRQFFEAVIAFNVRYGQYFRGQTSLMAFVTQSGLALCVGGLGAILLMAGLWPSALKRETKVTGVEGGPARGLAPWALVVGYVVLAAAIALNARKVQSYFILQLVYPLFFGGVLLFALRAWQGKQWGIRLVAAFCWGAAITITASSWSLAWPIVRGNAFAANQRMQTGEIARVLAIAAGAGHAAQAPVSASSIPHAGRPTLWVLGNRAGLYQLGDLHGLTNYDWTVYDTPLYGMPEETWKAWWSRLVAKPPDVIARYSNAMTTPWEPQPAASSRAAAIAEFIQRNYESVPLPAGTDSSWPYGYTISLYHLSATYAPTR